jgi:hypothetical protein
MPPTESSVISFAFNSSLTTNPVLDALGLIATYGKNCEECEMNIYAGRNYILF